MNKRITFEKKSRLFNTSKNPFFADFFDHEDIKPISKIFSEQKPFPEESLLTLLNNVMRMIGNFFPHVDMLSPNKPDEKKLLQEVEKHCNALVDKLYILHHQYGHETYDCLPIYSSAQKKFLNQAKFLEELIEQLRQLYIATPAAIEKISSKKAGKTGNKAKNAIPVLIYQLVNIYKCITGKNADQNFIHPKDSQLNYRGEFFDFVHIIFEIIQVKFKQKFQDRSNPLKITLEEKSKALGKQIGRTLKKSNKK